MLTTMIMCSVCQFFYVSRPYQSQIICLRFKLQFLSHQLTDTNSYHYSSMIRPIINQYILTTFQYVKLACYPAWSLLS